MDKYVDPKTFNLHPKTVIEQLGKDHLAIVITRKSRVVMSDGKKILEKVHRIKEVMPNSKVSLKISAALCGKTKKFLEDHGIATLFSV